jgi:hypothetical protein
MAVSFAPKYPDGHQMIDGVHNATCSDALAAQILTMLGLPTTVPGEATASLLYQKVLDFMAGPTYAAMNQADKDTVEMVRKGVRAGMAIETGIISWVAA